MANPKTFPVTFKVTNTGKRARSRNGVTFPGVKGSKKTEVEVEVSNKTEYLRLKACKSLQLAKTSGSKPAARKTTAAKTNSGSQGDGGDS